MNCLGLSAEDLVGKFCTLKIFGKHSGDPSVLRDKRDCAKSLVTLRVAPPGVAVQLDSYVAVTTDKAVQFFFSNTAGKFACFLKSIKF